MEASQQALIQTEHTERTIAVALFTERGKQNTIFHECPYIEPEKTKRIAVLQRGGCNQEDRGNVLRD